MGEDIEIYHVETQEDYDDLMIELEEQGYRWLTGEKLSSANGWIGSEEETSIHLNKYKDYTVTHGFISTARENNPDIPIIKYKAKGVNQMEKVVVPQFVADWFERNKKGHTIYGLLDLFSENYYLFEGFRKWVEEYNINEGDAQEIITKMYLFQNYEVEEKKYYWRKKKEYTFGFEHRRSVNYLNLYKGDNELFFSDTTELMACMAKFTEKEVKQLVGDEDFNKLEKVEITE